ncbi:MAG: hypothetical protein CM15mV101_390 [uncultured marine virus]|nr:MAG: hypothetical protein CM15mV101_390 [uncultured marine virus]
MGAHDEDKDMGMLKPRVQEEMTKEQIEQYAMQDLYTSPEKG